MSRPGCAVLLAAGLGTRLRPLTDLRPKALCPVGNVPILDRVLSLVGDLDLAGPSQVAVNASWLSGQLEEHLAGRAHMSVEPEPLGTAGGLSRLRDWIDGRDALVGNADAYLSGGGLDRLATGADEDTVRLLGVPGAAGEPGTFSGFRFAGFSVLPWRWVRDLTGTPRELVTAVWRPAEAAGRLRVVRHPGWFQDTGTPAGYLAANLHAAGGGNLIDPTATVTGRCVRSVVGAGAVVQGRVTGSVVWPGGWVGPGERLTGAVRAGRAVTLTGP